MLLVQNQHAGFPGPGCSGGVSVEARRSAAEA